MTTERQRNTFLEQKVVKLEDRIATLEMSVAAINTMIAEARDTVPVRQSLYAKAGR